MESVNEMLFFEWGFDFLLRQQKCFIDLEELK
jgi:hypothetical protein